MSTPLAATNYSKCSGLLAQLVNTGAITASTLLGFAIFSADRNVVALSDASPKPTVLSLPEIKVPLVDGAFTDAYLLGGNIPVADFQNWTWTVRFEVTTQTGIRVDIPERTFVALAGQSQDISTVAIVKQSTGTPTPAVVAPVVPSPTELIEANPQQPLWYDNDGVVNDSVYIYDATGVSWLINGSPVLAGVHYVSGTVTVTAVALEGYKLPVGTSPWVNEFSSVSATYVDAVTPFWNHADQSFVVPSVEGLTYYWDGSPLTPGDTIYVSGVVTVFAQANEGYVLNNSGYFQHDFAAAPAVESGAPNVTFDDIGLMFTVDAVAGVEYRVGPGQPNFNPVIEPGTYAAADYWVNNTVRVYAIVQSGYTAPSGSQFDFQWTYYPA
jgi:hypothetical protein